MPDGPKHLKNETVRHVSKGLKSPHHLMPLYFPWRSGTGECLGRERFRVPRSLISKLQMNQKE